MQFVTEIEAKELMIKYQEILDNKFPNENISVVYHTLANQEFNGKFKVLVSANNSIGNEDLDKYCFRNGIEFPI